MKELRAFIENFRAVFEPKDIIAMAILIIGTYISMILISGIFG